MKQHTIFQQPKNTMPSIEEVYMVVSVDAEDGNEGVVAAPIGGALMPLIAADRKRLEQIIPLAKQIATFSGMRLRLIKLSHREVVEEITP